jgi:hypothetical protein
MVMAQCLASVVVTTPSAKGHHTTFTLYLQILQRQLCVVVKILMPKKNWTSYLYKWIDFSWPSCSINLVCVWVEVKWPHIGLVSVSNQFPWSCPIENKITRTFLAALHRILASNGNRHKLYINIDGAVECYMIIRTHVNSYQAHCLKHSTWFHDCIEYTKMEKLKTALAANKMWGEENNLHSRSSTYKS